MEMGDFKEAVESFQKSLQLRQELSGNHSDTAESFLSLALAYCALGDKISSLRALQKAFDCMSHLLSCHDNTVCNYQSLAELQDIVQEVNGEIESCIKSL